MDTKKKKTKTKDKNQKNIEFDPAIRDDNQTEDDLLEEEDEDFGGLKALGNFKRQMGCGG